MTNVRYITKCNLLLNEHYMWLQEVKDEFSKQLHMHEIKTTLEITWNNIVVGDFKSHNMLLMIISWSYECVLRKRYEKKTDKRMF